MVVSCPRHLQQLVTVAPPPAGDITLHAHPDALDDLEDGCRNKPTTTGLLLLLLLLFISKYLFFHLVPYFLLMWCSLNYTAEDEMCSSLYYYSVLMNVV